MSPEANVSRSSHPARAPRQCQLPFDTRVERQFGEWIETPAGRYVECEVVRRARELQARGYRRYGISALIEVIRYHTPVPEDRGRDPWKCNNNMRSLLARKVMREHPELAGFFETRRLRGLL